MILDLFIYWQIYKGTIFNLLSHHRHNSIASHFSQKFLLKIVVESRPAAPFHFQLSGHLSLLTVGCIL